MQQKILRTRLLSAMLLLPFLPVMAQQANDSVDTYQNHTVSSTVNVQGQNTLTVADVTVTSIGELKLTAPEATVITSNLNVQLGGTLEINGSRQYFIRYTYDAAGNRIRREKHAE